MNRDHRTLGAFPPVNYRPRAFPAATEGSVGGLSRSGFLIPLALFALVAVIFFVFTVSTMKSGYLSQVKIVGQRQCLFNIAYSGFSRIIARIHEKSWDERYFSAGSVPENNVPMFDGHYDSFVEEAPAAPTSNGLRHPIDIYIRARFQERKQTFFWRVVYEEDIFDISNRIFSVFFSELDQEKFPEGASARATSDAFQTELAKILDQRRQNLQKALEESRKLAPISDVRAIANELTAAPPGEIPALPLNPGGIEPRPDQGMPVGVLTFPQADSITGFPASPRPPLIPAPENGTDLNPQFFFEELDRLAKLWLSKWQELNAVEMNDAHLKANELRVRYQRPEIYYAYPTTFDNDRKTFIEEYKKGAGADLARMKEIYQRNSDGIKGFNPDLPGLTKPVPNDGVDKSFLEMLQEIEGL